MKRALGLFTLITLISAVAMAQSPEITITSNSIQGAFGIWINQDPQGALQSLTVQGPQGNKTFSLQQLETPQVILASQGHNAIFLSVEPDFTPEGGGHVDMKYLTNALTNSYKIFRMLVDNGATIVVRADSTGAPFSHLEIDKGALGITKVVPSP